MRTLIAWLRFSLVILSMAMLIIATIILYYISLTLIRYPLRKIWSRCLIASTGATLSISGLNLNRVDLKNTMLVSNHISWLDTVVMLRLCYLSYIGKIEMLKWPLLNIIIKAGGTIFINRKNKRQTFEVIQQVAHLLSNGATVGLYPEGTTSDGKEILPFKTPFLEAALIAQSKIIPVVLSYRKENNQLATEVTFSKVNWLTTVMNTLYLKNLVIKVTILPPVFASNFANRELLAEHLYEQMRNTYLEH
ncbi:MAG: 1-acyl-sn-glycerol-3-phosphate acyltransferase [Burkholderiales bacterium]|nr:1-acyl-sn-glycerol-3-phosphate acyltransferase [Burkholderiales bacterium]